MAEIPSNGPFPHYRCYLHIYSALRARANCIIKTIMRLPQDQQAIEQVVEKLATFVGVPTATTRASDEDTPDRLRGFDALLKSGPFVFALIWNSSGSLGQIAHATDDLAMLGQNLPESHIPILAVPYMSKSAAEHCENTGVAWLDLSGNAKIKAPGLYVHVFGHRNLYARPGRPESAFAPRGSRVARCLLINPDQPALQRSIASAVGLNEGHVSRIVGKLVDMGLIVRNRDGIRVADPGRLLDAWRDEYRFDKHTVIPGHISVSGRDGVDLAVARTMTDEDGRYAVTGLSAAWRMTEWAGYRLTTVYLERQPAPQLLERLGFREEGRGANTWLVVPNDSGVFDGAAPVDGVNCVHPVQVYLDLKGHPERADEAAEELRGRLLR